MKDLTWIKQMHIAHRGFHSLDQSVPENSLTAIKKAMNQGFGIEIDINILKDGTIVVFHDPHLERLCRVKETLENVTYEDIKDLKILDTEERIPTLKMVLDLVKGKVPLLIELKPFGDKILMCKNFMKMMQNYQGKYGIHSFSPGIVHWFKKNYPSVIRGHITEYFRNNQKMNRVSKYLMKSLFFNRFITPDFINYGIHDLPNKYCDKAYRKGMCIIAYASKNQEEFDMVKKHYDNSVFEYFIPK